MSPELPRGFTMEEADTRRVGGGLRITHRPRRWPGAWRLCFSLLWFAFLSVFTLVAVSLGSDRGEYGMALISFPFWLVGLWMFYSGLVGLVNRTVVEVGGGRVRVRKVPLPQAGHLNIATGDVQHLYITMTRTRSRSGKQKNFAVHMVAGTGRKQLLADGFEREKDAVFLRERVETALDLAPALVPGAHQSPEGGRGGDPFGRSLEPVLPVPPRFEIYQADERLILHTRRHPARGIAMLAFDVVWVSGLVFITHQAPWFFLVFSIPFWLVGLGLLYGGLGLVLNRITICVGSRELSVRHEPIPWPGNGSVTVTNLKQLYVREEKIKGKGSTTYEYAVHAELHSGATIPLATGYTQRDEATFIERKIEDYLGIENRPVEGEA